MDTCTVCSKQFKTPTSLVRHVRESHENRTQVDCHQCSRSFKRQSSLNGHIKTCKAEQASTSTSSIKRGCLKARYISIKRSFNHNIIYSNYKCIPFI